MFHSNHFDWMFSNVVQIPMETWSESGPIPKTVGFREICNGCRSNLAGNRNLFCGGRDATVFAEFGNGSHMAVCYNSRSNMCYAWSLQYVDMEASGDVTEERSKHNQ